MSDLALCLAAARALVGQSQITVAEETSIERRAIGRIESGKFKLFPRQAFRLQALYEAHGVEFIGQTHVQCVGVRWKTPGRFDPFRSAQFRAARAMLSLSQRELAMKSGVDKNFISRLEMDKSKAVSMDRVQELASYFQQIGIELTPESDSFGAGVQFALSPLDKS